MRAALILAFAATSAACTLLVSTSGFTGGDAPDGGAPGGPDGGAPSDGAGEVGVGVGVDGGVDASGETGVDAGTDGDTPPAKPKLVFVTTAESNGALGGLTGADNECTKEGGKPCVAFLARNGMNATTRLTPGVPFALATGELVFDSAAAIAAGATPKVAITRAADGSLVTQNPDVWTGAKVGGDPLSGAACQGWTSDATTDTGAYGERAATDATWIQNDESDCHFFSARLYCFEL